MEVSNHTRKRKAIDAGNNSPPSLPPAYRSSDGYEPNSVDLSLLEALEKSSQNPVEAVDVKTLKKLVLSFERRLRDNIIKNPIRDSPIEDTLRFAVRFAPNILRK
ncbi:unnamed protein product [Arabis nemorensis]|uniref:Uncharacterized protein n=1 Tax=Arabis nemorensis TaxID=586526 RepID=A0A565B639_9BRAS|nr:unnamed protein product [Arabis nemorensis]